MKEVLDFDNPAKSCDKCAGVMKKGFIADYARGTADTSALQNVWVEGEYERKWWGSNIKDRRIYFIDTFRCTGCGFLESFATKIRK